MDGVSNSKARVVVAVYNPIEYDGRVKRVCETLAQKYEVKLFCLSDQFQFQSENYEIIRHHRENRSSPVLRLLGFWLGFIRFVLRQKPQLVYANDFFLALPGLIAAKLIGAVPVYDAHELIIPEPSIQMTLKERLFYLCERFSIRKYRIVIAANKQRAQLMKNHYKLTVIPIIVRNITKVTYNESSINEILAQYPLLRKKEGDFHIVYMGDINLSRGLGSLVNAIHLLPDNYKLILIGVGPDLAAIKISAANRRSNQLLIVGSVPNVDIQNVIATGDVGIVVYSMVGLNNIHCSPNKIFEYTQAGLPVITTSQAPLKEMIEKYGVGLVVGSDSPLTATSYADAMHFVTSNLKKYKNNIPNFLQHHRFEVEQINLLDAVMPLLNGSEQKQ
jgi:glycosyltransferase involved in cell wall biosynthesis